MELTDKGFVVLSASDRRTAVAALRRSGKEELAKALTETFAHREFDRPTISHIAGYVAVCASELVGAQAFLDEYTPLADLVRQTRYKVATKLKIDDF